MKRKTKFIIWMIAAITFLGIIFGIVDYNYIKNGKMPIFMIRITSACKSKLNYIGLGYRMQRKVGLSYKQEIHMDDYVKFGSWFYVSEVKINRKFNNEIELNIINDKIIKYFLLDNAELKDNMSFNYIDVTNNVVVVGLISNNEEYQNRFRKLVIDSNLIVFVQGENNNFYQ